jgi:hypothetical protein
VSIDWAKTYVRPFQFPLRVRDQPELSNLILYATPSLDIPNLPFPVGRCHLRLLTYLIMSKIRSRGIRQSTVPHRLPVIIPVRLGSRRISAILPWFRPQALGSQNLAGKFLPT